MPAVFYYDFASPASYLVAERIVEVLGEVPEWQPVRQADLNAEAPVFDHDAIEQTATELQLQPIRWPDRVPCDSELALLAATYAKQIGRVVAFSLAAFRQAYAGGADLSELDRVLIAAAACELHPKAVTKAIGLGSVTEQLASATEQAKAIGVRRLPALSNDDEIIESDSLTRMIGDQKLHHV